MGERSPAFWLLRWGSLLVYIAVPTELLSMFYSIKNMYIFRQRLFFATFFWWHQCLDFWANVANAVQALRISFFFFFKFLKASQERWFRYFLNYGWGRLSVLSFVWIGTHKLIFVTILISGPCSQTRSDSRPPLAAAALCFCVATALASALLKMCLGVMNYPSCYCFCFHLYLHLPTGIGWLHTIKHESQAQAKSPAADWTGAALGFCGWGRIYLMSIRSILCQDRSRAGNECILMGTARVKMVWFFMVEHVRPPCVYSYWGCAFQRTFCFLETLRCWWKVNNWRNSATFVHSE